ncbi:hypothetical protein MITS9509_01242 [Synechococcus sp. MIT S9509]|nr:hypothetical protein MITS9504_00807 [Synechococcus sp. MIT S9504]KZR92792.1 hypothetical protein MITS9509_01242 [Synechococcus sp. MIT S9509]
MAVDLAGIQQGKQQTDLSPVEAKDALKRL